MKEWMRKNNKDKKPEDKKMREFLKSEITLKTN
jgi:hypothetical protein